MVGERWECACEWVRVCVEVSVASQELDEAAAAAATAPAAAGVVEMEVEVDNDRVYLQRSQNHRPLGTLPMP